MQKELLTDHGINLAALPRGDDSRAQALSTPGLAKQLMVERATGTPLPHYQQRTAIATGRAPLVAPNVQARDTVRAWRWLDAAAVQVPHEPPGIRRATGAVAVAVAAEGELLQREMVDWSAEYAALQAKKAGGRVHVIALAALSAAEGLPEAAAAEAAREPCPIEAACAIQWAARQQHTTTAQLPSKLAPPTQLSSVRLAPRGAPVSRVREVDLVRVYSCPMPPGWAEMALTDLEPITGYLNNFHEKWHEKDPRRAQVSPTLLPCYPATLLPSLLPSADEDHRVGLVGVSGRLEEAEGGAGSGGAVQVECMGAPSWACIWREAPLSDHALHVEGM